MASKKTQRLAIPVWGPNSKDEASQEEIDEADLEALIDLLDEDDE